MYSGEGRREGAEMGGMGSNRQAEPDRKRGPANKCTHTQTHHHGGGRREKCVCVCGDGGVVQS